MAERQSGAEQHPVPPAPTRRSSLHRAGHPGPHRRGRFIREGILVGLASCSLVFMATNAMGQGPTPFIPLAATMFREVEVAPPTPRPDPTPSEAPSWMPPSTPTEPASPTLTATPIQTAPPRPQPRPTARPLQPRSTSPSTGHSVSGTPTYYCRAGISRCTRGYPDRPGIADYYAAAGPSLRVGNWRGRIVNVHANGRILRVRLIDWCACGGSHFLDLYWDAFKALGRPSHARVTW